MGSQLLWWVTGPVAAIALLSGGYWITASKRTQAAPQAVQVETQQVAMANDHTRREYVLEVIGLGVTLDKYRQGTLWEVLQKGNPYATIREQDKEKYPWSASDKAGISGGRTGDTLENGAAYTPMYWGVPSFYASFPNADPNDQPSSINPVGGLAAGARSSGMAWHLFVTGPWQLDEHPDRILEKVFAFFDAHPDIPYLVLGAVDDMYTRNSARLPGMPELVRDGNYIPEMPDASALFVLARRERVDPLRPFAWDDPDNDFVQNQLRWMYGDLMESVPHPERKTVTRTPAQVGADTSHQDIDPWPARQPLVSEWLEAAAAFAQRADIRGTGPISLLSKVDPWAHRPPKNWKPTPWFPIPWNKDQLATFDRLPTLGYIHRPIFIKFMDKDGQSLTRQDERQKVLQAGWQEALQTLPEGERMKAPARIVTATGGNSEQLIMLHHTLNDYAAKGGPELTANTPGLLIDTDRRLGNTGAATLFMQMAIGVMGSYRAGGVSAAINLRDPNEASIVMVSPPSEAQRKTQRHPNGGDVFAHHGRPAVDPANYGR